LTLTEWMIRKNGCIVGADVQAPADATILLFSRQLGAVDKAIALTLIAWVGAPELTLVALEGRQFLAADTELAPSFLRLAPIQGIKCKQDLAGLAPKGCFVSAEAVECTVG
jgi:hypothetical protein